MPQTIKLKRGTGSAAPAASDLVEGELAYAEDRSNNGASAKLYISSINSSSAEVVQTVGGKYYTDIVDAATDANTASKLVKRDGSGNFAAGTITANLTGNASGTSGSTTGNAATATEATSFTTSANNSTDETVYPVFVDGATGTQGAETDTGLTYNPSSGILTSTNFTGAVTGNADTATKIASITNSNIVQLAETQTLTNKTLTSPVLNTGISGSAIKDEDNMASNSATHIATQQSVKAYVDTQVATAASVDDATALAIALG